MASDQREENRKPPRRLRRERKTLEAMVRIYCRGRHGTKGKVCSDCADFLDYAFKRLEKCPFGENKPTCAKCPIHCYRPDRRKKAKEIMAYAGPRMVYRHPLLAFLHMWDGLRKRPAGKRMV